MKNEQKKISIIIPVYNAKEYLNDCINSVLTQNYKNIEVVLINDGSSDGSAMICEEYAKRDSRVVYRYQNNAGVSAARNHGLDICTGEYIAFVDSDDQLKADAIGSLVRNLEDSQADLCVCGYDILMKDNTLLRTIADELVVGIPKIAEYFALHYLEAIASSVWGKLYKRVFLDHRFDSSITMGEDLLFNLEYIQKIQSVRAISDSLYQYNMQNENSLVNNYKLGYYEQDLYVTKQWLCWIDQLNVGDNTNLYYRISSSFFCAMQVICPAAGVQDGIYTVKEMISEDLLTAIKRSIHRYNVLQKIILRLLIEERYRVAVVMVKFYMYLKQIR